MTAVESLPAYASAEKVAKDQGLNINDLLNAYLAGFASARQYEKLDDNEDYMSPNVLPSETVYATPEATRMHFEGLLNEVRHGV